MRPLRPLTPSQEKRLEEIAEESPQVRVIGWEPTRMGPVLQNGTAIFELTRNGKIHPRAA